MPQNTAQRGRERQTDLAVNLYLTDAGLLVFDRVFDGDDLARFVLNLVEGAVKRGAFAGAGRPRHEDDAVRHVDELAEEGVGVLGHADVGEVKDHAALVKQTHDDAFAVDHGDDRHTNVYFAVLHAHLDTAVLRHALLGDVETGHDLDAAEDGGLEAVDLGVQRLCLQNAVDAIADAQGTFFRLNVDVAGALVGGFDQDFVDQLDDAGFLGHLGRFAVVSVQA